VATETPSFYDKIVHMAEEMGLKDDERDNFINQAMEKKGGHRKVTTWVPDDGKGGDDGKKPPSWF